MKKLDESGFGAVEALLIFVIVGLIGVAGYYVYNSQKKTSTSLDNAASSQAELQKQTTAKPTTDKLSVKERSLEPSARANNWTIYDDKTNSSSLRIPDGWQVATYKSSPGSLIAWCGSGTYWNNLECITYKQGVKAVITEQAYPTEGFSYFSFTFQTGVKNFPEQSEDEKVLEKLTTKSATIYKTEISYLTYSGQDEKDKTPAGTKYYSYYIKKGEKLYLMHYGLKPGESSQLELVEESLASFQ